MMPMRIGFMMLKLGLFSDVLNDKYPMNYDIADPIQSARFCRIAPAFQSAEASLSCRAMKFISLAAVSLLCLFALPLAAQDSETQEQLKKATEAAKKMGGKLPDMSAINAMTDDM